MKYQANRSTHKFIQKSGTLRWLTPLVLVSALAACGQAEDGVVENDSVQNPASPQQTTQRTVDPGSPLPVTRPANGAGTAAGAAGAGSPLSAGSAPSDAPPTVTSSTPLDRDDMIMTSTDEITATFSKAMDPMSITAASFSLACPAGSEQQGTITYAPRGNVATMTLPDSLPPRSICVATIGTGVKDMAGTAMTAPHSWTFTTGNDATVTPLSSNQ